MRRAKQTFIGLILLVLVVFCVRQLVFAQAKSPAFRKTHAKKTDSSKFTQATWLERARAAGLNKNLRGAKLNNVDLSNMVFLSADLTGATLKGSILKGAIFCNADLTGADLSGAILDRANLSGAILVGANLSGANLTRVNLSKCDLSAVNLSKAQ